MAPFFLLPGITKSTFKTAVSSHKPSQIGHFGGRLDLCLKKMTFARSASPPPGMYAINVPNRSNAALDLIAMSIYDKCSISPIYSTDLYQMLFYNDSYDPGV